LRPLGELQYLREAKSTALNQDLATEWMVSATVENRVPDANRKRKP
jgi:hypothetical protein